MCVCVNVRYPIYYNLEISMGGKSVISMHDTQTVLSNQRIREAVTEPDKV